MKLSIIIPVYNEQQTIRKILEEVAKVDLGDLGITKEVVIVDDGSTDGTQDILGGLEDGNYIICVHQENQGKGASIQTGLSRASGEIIIIQDADLEYDPREYRKLIQPILSGRADVVYGSRFVGSEPHRALFIWHYFGNKLITGLCNLFSNLNLSDIETGYKAFSRPVLDSIQLAEKDFGFEAEVTIKLARKRYRFYEVGISYYGRDYAEGKKIGWPDGLRAVFVILKYGMGLG